MVILDYKTTEYVLDNGLKVLFKNYPSCPSSTFMVWYKVGSRNEQAGKTGISHFLEHMSFKRTEFFDKGQIVSEITRNGGTFNAYTSRDFTAYFESFATSKLELSMIIESQRMNKLVLNQEDVEKEVGVILSELEKNLDNPYNVLEMALREKAYKKHPYRYSVLGTEEDIKSINADDLNQYYRKFYAPNNATIVVVGSFDEKQVLELIRKYFDPINPVNIKDHVQKEAYQGHSKTVKVRKTGSTPIVKFAYHIPSINNEDIFPLITLGEMLNSGMSSRVYQSMVEPQLAIDVSVNTEIVKDPGLFTIIATLFPKTGHKEAEEVLLNEIRSITDGKPPTKEELENTKRRIKSSFEFNKDGTFKLAYLLGYYETIASHNFIDNYVQNIEKVTQEDIKRVADKYLTLSNSTIAHFIPSHEQPKNYISEYEYTPHETKDHKYKAPPIIIDEKIKCAPITYTKKIIDNGLRILISENKTSDTVKLFGTINAGNLYSATVNPALPAVCAGMLNRGSRGKTRLQIAEDVESRGASVGISSVNEAVNFSLSSTSQDFPYILSILAKILMEPTFPEDEFLKYKRFAIAGIRQKKDDPEHIARLNFSHMVYPRKHLFYTYTINSQEKQIKDLTITDIKDFYETYYSPSSIILGISGNIDTEKAIKHIKELFGNWQPKEIPEPYIKPVTLQRKYKEKTINVEGKSEAEVIFGHFGNLKRKDEDFYSATVMNFILGGSGALSSRIGRRIREDLGLVYSISSGFNALSIPGAWTVKFGIDCHYADTAIQALKEEISRFIEHGAMDDEVDLAKSCLIGSYPLRFSSNSGIARALLVNEYYDLDENYLNKYPDIINTITKEEINTAAKKYLHPEVASVVKAGNFK